MFLLASTLYLPNHLATISRRAYYYFAGDATNLFHDASSSASSSSAAALFSDGTAASRASEAVCEAATGFYQAAVNTAVAVAQDVQQAVSTMGWV